MNLSFYMVYVEGESTPTYKHISLKSAEIEAKRLAKQLHKKAYVLASVKSFEIIEFKEESCVPDELSNETDSLPF